MLNIKNLSKKYKNIEVVKGIDFELKKGEILGLLGPNGAGKSTVISMISTLIRPTTGEILLEGKSIIKDTKIMKDALGLVPQEIALYEKLTGLENLMFFGKAYGLKKNIIKERIKEISKIIGIEERLNEKVDTYSGGMKRRLNIGVALINKPSLLIMDEPTVGIDPQSRDHILKSIKILNEKYGLTVIYTSHYMNEIEALCNNICIMDEGKIIAKGSKENLLKLYNLKESENLENLFFELTGRGLRD